MHIVSCSSKGSSIFATVWTGPFSASSSVLQSFWGPGPIWLQSIFYSLSLSSGTHCISNYNQPQQSIQGWVAWCMNLWNHRWRYRALNILEVVQGGEWWCKGKHHPAMRPRQADWVGWLTSQWSALHHGYPWKNKRHTQRWDDYWYKYK